MNYKNSLEKIERTPIKSVTDLELVIDLLKHKCPKNNVYDITKKSYITETLKSKFSSFIKTNQNANITDFLYHLYSTDSDLKYLYTQYKSLKSTISKRVEITNDLKSVGYFLEDKEPYFSGRENELKYMKMNLNRKIKNNVLLIGEPGVGKTSLVKQYNQIFEDEIFVVEMDKVISGTKYRGEFEGKLAKILDYSKENQVTIFIDEVHILLGVGKSEGGLSGADILKPYVTDPQIKVIGATTMEEFQILRSDRALERRFNILKLNEINQEGVKKIYLKLLKFLEIETLNENDFSKIYSCLLRNQNRKFPDKLVDFLDLYSSYEKCSNNVILEEVLNMVLYDGY